MNAFLEKHPYNLRERVPEETRLLFVGTAPPPRFSNPACGGTRGIDFDFFYGSEDNYMWEFFFFFAVCMDNKKLFSDEMSSDECCVAARRFLQHHDAWMHDVLQEYHRKEDKECDAADSNIVPKRFTDFHEIIDRKSLSTIAFTSEQAAKWTFEALAEQKILTQNNFKQKLDAWKHANGTSAKERYESPLSVEKLDGREVQFRLLPTPTGRSREGLKLSDKLSIYKKLF